MKNEFVTYNQALSLKELGFDEPCFGYYTFEFKNPSKITLHQGLWNSNTSQEECKNNYVGMLAPLYQQAFRWFRKKHSSHSHVSKYQDNNFYHYDIFYDEVDEDGDECFITHPCNHLYHSYEVAESACLDKLIEIVKNNQN